MVRESVFANMSYDDLVKACEGVFIFQSEGVKFGVSNGRLCFITDGRNAKELLGVMVFDNHGNIVE
jgi:hypothetical protein